MRVRPEVVEKVKYLANKAHVTPSRFLSNVLETVLPDLMLCENLGIFQIAVLLRDLKAQLRSWSESVKDEPENVEMTA
jgi:hypothetical protein